MTGGGDWYPISRVPAFARPKFVQMAYKGLLPTRARTYLEDKLSEEANAQIRGAHLQAYQARSLGLPAPTDKDLEEMIDAIEATRFSYPDHPIDAWVWSIIGNDGAIWEDSTWVSPTQGGKFGLYLIGIEFRFGECDWLREAWLEPEQSITTSTRPAKRRGPTLKYDRENFVAEAVARLEHEGGFTTGEFNKADLYETMIAWCKKQRWTNIPERSWMYDRIDEAENAYLSANSGN